MQSVLAKWYCGCLIILLDIKMRNMGRSDRSGKCVYIFGFEEGCSATEIFTAI